VPGPSSPVAWITASEEELLAELESLGRKLAVELGELGLDVAAHQRKFWDEWAKQDETATVAARNRQCEYQCRALAAAVIERRALVSAITAKYDAVVNVLDVRLGRPLRPRSPLEAPAPFDQGVSVAS
jgi:hypothetical protein